MHTTYLRGGLAGLGARWKAQRLIAVGVFALLLTMPMAPETVTVTNSTFGTVDGSVGGGTLIRAFDVSDAGTTITNVDILIDFSKCGNPAPGRNDTRCLGTGFSSNSDISFTLMSPSGITVNLVSAENPSMESPGTYDGQTPGARVSVTFDDAAENPVGTPPPSTEGSSLRFGPFQPVEPLIEFDSQSQSPNGTWTLILQDTPNDSFSNGSLQFYSATLCINEPCPAITSLIIGDVDASDARDAVDASVLLEALVGVNPPDAIHVSAAGDVNADSIIDNRDSILILAIVAGRILPPPNLNSITATALATGAVINITGSVDPTRANRTVNLRNTANNATTFTTADTQGSFGSLAPVTLPGGAGNTIVADIDGSPARAAILVQQGGGEGPALLALPQ
jgi:hypothetical protein